MGSAFSKPKPVVKPRDDKRIAAAREHVNPILPQLRALNDRIEGQVLIAPHTNEESNPPDAELYHQQRERPFYFNEANYPSAIVLVSSIQDVCEAVKLIGTLDAATYRLCIAAGCHSAYCMAEKSIVIDLNKLNECTVCKDSSTIKIQGGAKIEQAHSVLKGTGLSFATGTNGDTGVSGLTLAGGAGYLGGQAGFACDTVTAAQVVLPSGELVSATDDNEHADLLRALRGGGGNFGVVVEWTFQLFDVSNAFGGTVVHMCPTMGSIHNVLANYAECVKDIPDQCCSVCALPAGAPVFVNVLTMIGSEVPKGPNAKYTEIPFFQKTTNLGAWFKASNDLGRKDYIGEIAVLLESVQQRAFGSPVGAMVYSFDKAIQEALIHFTRVDCPKKNQRGTIIVMNLSGEMRRRDASRSSLTHRKAEAWIIIEPEWEPHASSEEVQAVIDWAKRAKQRIVELGGEDGPHNFCDTDGRRIKFFTDEQRTFLEAAKKKYDPNNLFTLNKNIGSHVE